MTQFLESGFMFEPEEREDNDTDTQEDVSEFPDANFTDADEELDIFGLGEGEVQSALTNTGHERFHTRLYDHLDKSPNEQIYAEEDEDFLNRYVSDYRDTSMFSVDEILSILRAEKTPVFRLSSFFDLL